MKKAILYMRFNSIEEAKGKIEVENLLDRIETFCNDHEIEIIQEFADISTDPPLKRYYFDKALKYSKHLSEEIKYFLVIDCTSISEKYLEFIEIRNELRPFEISIIPIIQDGSISIEQFYNQLNN